MNKVIITGRITKDPELKYTQNGLPNLRFAIACDRVQRDASGNRQADFINCVAFSQQADFISRFIKKGYMMLIEGRIQTGQFQGQDGQVRYTTDVIVERVENLQPRDNSQAQPSQQVQQNPYQGYNNPSYGAPQQNNYASNDAPQSFDVNVDDNDLPF